MIKKIRKVRGITLVSLTITVVVILIISGVVLYNVRTNLSVQKFKNMQSDIENLKGKVSNYYLQYGALPTIGSNINENIISNVKQAANNNIDTGNYYVIDLSAMENITLKYGTDYKQITSNNASTLNNNSLDDVYIINSVSHNIFYVKGIEYEDESYYTIYQNTNDIGLSEINESLQNSQTEKAWSQIYSSQRTYTDRNGARAMIPAGFKVSMKYEENTIENGLVVADANDNEWVWIPVSSTDLAKMYEEDSTGWTMLDTNVNTTYRTIETTFENETLERIKPGEIISPYYREPDVLSNIDHDKNADNRIAAGFIENNGTASSLETMATKLKEDYKNMIDSVKINGGFYVGRYEIGKDTNNNPQIKSGTVMNMTNWYNLYSACKSFSNSNIESRMIWGCQWDQICRFINERGNKVSLYNPKTYGNYSDSEGLALTDSGRDNFNNTTGRNQAWQINNIYDFGGNCCEFTQEATYTERRAMRGR